MLHLAHKAKEKEKKREKEEKVSFIRFNDYGSPHIGLENFRNTSRRGHIGNSCA